MVDWSVMGRVFSGARRTGVAPMAVELCLKFTQAPGGLSTVIHFGVGNDADGPAAGLMNRWSGLSLGHGYRRRS